MRREIIGILSVLVLLLVLVGGCGGGGDDLMPRITALATSQLTLRPNAAGAYTGIAGQSPNSGEHWEKVDEASADETSTYVETDSDSQQKDAYALPNHTTETGTISSVTVWFRFTRDRTSGGTLAYCQPFLKLSASETAGTERSLDSTTWTTYNEILARPGGGTWSWTDIDDLQVCIRLRDTGTGSPKKYAQCTQVYVVVEHVTNQAPVANNQSGLSVNSCSTLTVTLNGTDPDGDPLTYVISTLPGHGNLYNGTGTGGTNITSVPYNVTDPAHNVTYQPYASYNGSDTFGFKVNDGALNSTEATISITVSDGRTTWYLDSDLDGYGNATATQQACSAPAGYVADNTDCNDSNGGVHPLATEVCNGIDDDCDGFTDEGAIGSTWYRDFDLDTYGDPAVTTQNCTQPAGYIADNTDCDDSNAAVHPGATEVCNGYDDDCDGSIDEGVKTTYYRDADSDTYGDPAVTTEACSVPAGYVSNNTDCDDSDAKEHPGQTWYKDADNDLYSDGATNTTSCTRPAGYKVSSELTATSGDCNDIVAAVNPGATEACNGIDDDCDGSIDEGAIGSTWYRDADSDTYGNATNTMVACNQPVGYVSDHTDCNDIVAAVNPGATEACNGIDDDCDGSIDEGAIGSTWYRDSDSDTYGNATNTMVACNQPVGYVLDNTDCNDNNSNVHPGATEVCNGIDDDCDGSIDEGAIGSTWYRDSDSDTYGNATNTMVACSAPVGYVSNNTDCNDSNGAVHPGATEVCNGIDDDCDGSIDEGVTTYTWYRDFDGDGYGNATATTQACSAPVGYVSDNTDCNDSNADVHPGATEVCNGIDDDCDGSIDEGAIGSTWYRDNDGDNHGNPAVTTQNCTQPSGYVSDNTDCNDGDNTIYPGALELCDGKDNDCDGNIDEGVTTYTWYRDADGDNYGNGAVSTQNCTQPQGYVLDSTDCNDNDNTVYPDAAELPDGKDNDCDGNTDEGTWTRSVQPEMWRILMIQSTEGGKVTEPTQGNFPYGGGDFLAYYPDTVVDLVATPDAGYRFVGWTGAPDMIADVNAASTTIIMSRDCAIKANFAEIPPETPEIVLYDLTISSTSGGSVSVPGEGTFTYNASTVLDLVAKADSGYKFVHWTGDVTTIANVNGATTSITMNGDYSIVANFEKIPPGKVTLTVSSTDGGLVTAPGERTFAYDEGTVVNLEAEPEEGYSFVKWIGDVDDVADVTAVSTTITMNDNYSITATFKFGKGCFIATAAYGTPMAEEIQILRDFRDEYLVTNPVGKALVDFYYRVSPPIAEFITEHPSLKPIVRAGLVPAVAMSTITVNTSPAEKAAIIGLLVLLSLALAVWLARRRGRRSEYI